VDEDALLAHLQDGKLAGAYLDTFEKEPYTGPLTSMENVLLTPHMGSYAAECRLRMETEAVENLLDFFKINV
jgi:D-3-phosphoglycerate dehydrogenase